MSLQFFLGGVAGPVEADVTAASTYIMTAHASAIVSRSVFADSTYIMTPSDGAVSTFDVEVAATYVFTPEATSTAIRLAGVGIGDDLPTYIMTPLGTQTTDFKVVAASTYIFTPTSSERHVESGTVAVTYVFTAQASTTAILGVGTGIGSDVPTYIFTPEATGAVPNPHREAHVDYIFRVEATAVVVALDCTPLGRFRRGDVVTLELDLEFIPDTSPYAVVLDESDEPVQVFQLSRGAADPGKHVYDLFVGPGYQAERYVVVFTVLAGGVQARQEDQCFLVVGGGDAGGPVISLACYQRGKLQAVLAHLGNGELVLGKNPSLDYTPPSSLPPGWQVAPVG